MSRIREAHHRLLELLQRELKREDQEVREQREPIRPNPRETGGPEVDDLPLGVPPDPTTEVETPGFPHGDPNHG